MAFTEHANTLIAVAVPGADALMSTEFDGQCWAALRPMCECLGIDFSGQLQRLKDRSWATVGIISTVAADGKLRDMVMVDSRTIPMWLATIDENKVNAQARPKLLAYQREARDALDAYFNRPRRPTTIDGIRAMLDQIEAAEREAAEAKEIAERTEARVDAIKGRHGWFTVLAYAIRISWPDTSEPTMARIGKRAAEIGRARGIEPGQSPHPRFGYVNLWPEAVLADAFAEEP